jgi:hypothetical protein
MIALPSRRLPVIIFILTGTIRAGTGKGKETAKIRIYIYILCHQNRFFE